MKDKSVYTTVGASLAVKSVQWSSEFESFLHTYN